MNRKVKQVLTAGMLGIAITFTASQAIAQQNDNTAKGQMKQSGSEVRKAGTSMGHDMKHGRVVRGGKHFGQHIGHAGKHFGRGTKKAVKHTVS